MVSKINELIQKTEGRSATYTKTIMQCTIKYYEHIGISSDDPLLLAMRESARKIADMEAINARQAWTRWRNSLPWRKRRKEPEYAPNEYILTYWEKESESAQDDFIAVLKEMETDV